MEGGGIYGLGCLWRAGVSMVWGVYGGREYLWFGGVRETQTIDRSRDPNPPVGLTRGGFARGAPHPCPGKARTRRVFVVGDLGHRQDRLVPRLEIALSRLPICMLWNDNNLVPGLSCARIVLWVSMPFGGRRERGRCAWAQGGGISTGQDEREKRGAE